MSPLPHIVELWVYPVKSFRGIQCASATLGESGLEYDREWMVVDEYGRFLTQREEPRMALMSTALNEKHLILDHPSEGSCYVAVDASHNTKSTVEVWEDQCEAVDEGTEVADFLSACFNRDLRLVRMTSPASRRLEPKHQQLVQRTVPMHFGDSQPLHLLNVQSLHDLNRRLDVPVKADRFRANIIIDGLHAYVEDYLSAYRIGSTHFRQSKTTARCVMTTINQQQATSSKEPLRTLSAYRSINNRVVFGSYFVHEEVGAVLEVGDGLEELEWMAQT